MPKPERSMPGTKRHSSPPLKKPTAPKRATTTRKTAPNNTSPKKK